MLLPSTATAAAAALAFGRRSSPSAALVERHWRGRRMLTPQAASEGDEREEDLPPLSHATPAPTHATPYTCEPYTCEPYTRSHTHTLHAPSKLPGTAQGGRTVRTGYTYRAFAYSTYYVRYNLARKRTNSRYKSPHRETFGLHAYSYCFSSFAPALSTSLSPHDASFFFPRNTHVTTHVLSERMTQNLHLSHRLCGQTDRQF